MWDIYRDRIAMMRTPNNGDMCLNYENGPKMVFLISQIMP